MTTATLPLHRPQLRSSRLALTLALAAVVTTVALWVPGWASRPITDPVAVVATPVLAENSAQPTPAPQPVPVAPEASAVQPAQAATRPPRPAPQPVPPAPER